MVAVSETSEYHIWEAMKQRCLNPNAGHYEDYGGRGITIHQPWADSFKAFHNDVGDRPTKLHSLDRIDNDGNYEPGNIRWVTRKEQNNNKRTNVYIDYQGVSMTISQWADHLGISYDNFQWRLRAMPLERAMTKGPLREKQQDEEEE